MSTETKKRYVPADGLAGLKESYSTDALSGFLVFLLALPLSLGIAKASDFPAIFGLVTAMIGGVVVSFIAGSRLTIKGPAAGLIVIVAGSVAELGAGDTTLGWHLALGAVVVAGALQVVFGLLKFGKLSDFFPISAVEGMLAAIGIIILSKQIHILVGVNPTTHEGKPMVEPMELLGLIPNTIMNFFAHKEVAIVGLVSLAIVFGWPMIKNKMIKKIPAPLVVLLVAIPLAHFLGIHNIKADEAAGIKAFNPLVSFDKGLFDILGINVSFAGMSQIGTFIKFVVMFALVGSLEALLTVKAIDGLDPYKRKSDYNKDLIAVGIGNIIAGVLGGLPMISEVARSSANVNNGAKTRWANFFHGIFIMLFLIFATVFSNLIPMAALAAMLIGVGVKLAHPRVFKHMLHIGKEQLIIFCVTIVFTLATDLLVGIAAGILTKMIFHLVNGASIGQLFKTESQVSNTNGNDVTLHVNGALLFSNIIGFKKVFDTIPQGKNVTIDVSKAKMVDHTSILTINSLVDDYKDAGGNIHVSGFDHHKQLGHDGTSARVLK